MSDIPVKKKMSRKKKVILTIVIVLVALFLIADIIGANYLVYFAIERKQTFNSEIVPDAPVTGDEQAEINENRDVLYEESISWIEEHPASDVYVTSDDGLRLKGSLLEAPNESHLWAIVCHGYSSNRYMSIVSGTKYNQWGFNVIMPDMRAHGESEGKYIGMGWLDRKDMLKWIDLILEMDPRARIVLHGTSMGGATVLMTSGESLPENVECVVSDCAYTSVYEIFKDELKFIFGLPEFPLMPSASLASKIQAGYFFGEASSLNQVKKATVPILFIHGDADTFVKTDMVYVLHDACPTEKELLVVEGAPHGQSNYKDTELYYSTMEKFLEKVMKISL